MDREEIKSRLEELDIDTLITIWNEYCDNNNDPDSRIFRNDEPDLDDLLGGMTVSEILRMATWGDYNYANDWCSFNGYGNLVSFNYLEDESCPISVDDLVIYLEDNEDMLEEYNLNDDEEEEDEEDDGE